MLKWDCAVDKVAVTRIMHELVDKELVRSSLGMGSLILLPKSLQHLQQLHGVEDSRSIPASINISAGPHANVQVMQHSPQGVQTGRAGDEIHEVRAFAQQLEAALPQIQEKVTPEQFADIKDDLDTLKKKLDASAPSKPMIKLVKEELVKRLVGLPFDALKLLPAAMGIGG